MNRRNFLKNIGGLLAVLPFATETKSEPSGEVLVVNEPDTSFYVDPPTFQIQVNANDPVGHYEVTIDGTTMRIPLYDS